MTENKEFIDEYYDRVESTLKIPALSRKINEKKSKIGKTIQETCKIIRGVTADMSPSERFVSEKIDLLPVKVKSGSFRNKDGHYEEIEYNTRTALVLNHKGFNSLRLCNDKRVNTYDSTYANPIGYKMMLTGIADSNKMMTLLRELIDKNKKKASQRCMDLMKISSEAEKLLVYGSEAQERYIKTTLEEPIEIDLININTNYGNYKVELNKKFFLVEYIHLFERSNLSLVGRDINGNLVEKTISPANLEDYNIFMQLITPLERAFKKMDEELDEKEKEINVIVEAINIKLSSYLVLFKLDNTLLDKMGHVDWATAPYDY